jgi:type VI secretion system secreted protein VgrG
MARVFELISPLGNDLLFRSMTGTEELGRLSEFDISALSPRADIELSELLAKNVTVKMELRSGTGFRFFNGFVTRFAQEGKLGRLFLYRLIVRPWLWFLTRTSDCRIFQDKTVPAIIKDVFDDQPLALFDDELSGKHPAREYCVQYRETDFNFVSRLMEEEGIYYFFEHQEGRHVLKLVDDTSAHKVLQNRATIAFSPPGRPVRVSDEFIRVWNFDKSIQPGVVGLDDYDFKRPKAELGVRAQILEPHEQANHEVFDFPGEYIETEDGENLARARIEEFHSQFDRAYAECNVREIAVGRLFNLVEGPRPDQEREYLITSASYDLRNNEFESVAEEPASYFCRFTVLHTGQQFRPERLTLEPKMTGPQTAVVVADANEEILCDRFGRIKVVFHWDRRGKDRFLKDKDPNTSCFLRIAHPWAGSNWGVIFLPRKGQEVLVDFLEGDPDRPIIVGSVYNADQMPPFDLPANKTQSGIKTRSTLNGTPSNFNEIRFEDKKGQEELVVHAERNLSTTVEANESRGVGGSRSTSIGHDDTHRVKRHLTVNVDEGNYNTTVSQGVMFTDVPNAQYHVHAKKIWHISEEEITLDVHGSTIRIDPSSITLTSMGNKIVLNASGIQINGTVLIDIKAALVKINS